MNHIYQPGVLSTKITFGIDFTDKPVVQCDGPVVKNAFVDDCKLMIKMIIDTNDCKFDVNT